MRIRDRIIARKREKECEIFRNRNSERESGRLNGDTERERVVRE
jgi:hypothetical protein